MPARFAKSVCVAEPLVIRRCVPRKRGKEVVMQYDLWSYRTDVVIPGELVDLTGYEVEATDGKIGKVDEATNDVGTSHVVVDTGPWIFGKKVMLPAGTIVRMDAAEQKVYLDRTKDEIKSAPEYDEQLRKDPDYHTQLGDHYGRPGAGR